MAFDGALPNHCFVGKKCHSPLSRILQSLVSTFSKTMYISVFCCKNTGYMTIARPFPQQLMASETNYSPPYVINCAYRVFQSVRVFCCTVLYCSCTVFIWLMTKCNRTVYYERSNLDRRVNPNTLSWLNEGIQKSFSPPLVWSFLWNHSVVEITPQVKLRRTLLGKILFRQLASISEWIPSSRNVSLTFKATENPYCISYTRIVNFWDQVQWELSRALGISEAIITGVSNDVFCWARFLPSSLLQMRNKYRNRLHMKNTGETPCNLNWATCKLLYKNLQINTNRKVRISWNQLLFWKWHT